MVLVLDCINMLQLNRVAAQRCAAAVAPGGVVVVAEAAPSSGLVGGHRGAQLSAGALGRRHHNTSMERPNWAPEVRK